MAKVYSKETCRVLGRSLLASEGKKVTNNDLAVAAGFDSLKKEPKNKGKEIDVADVQKLNDEDTALTEQVEIKPVKGARK